jgi:amino acid transporter
MACDGLLPEVLARRNRARVPWVALVVCATCWALALKLTFERLITLDVLLWGLSLSLEFAALVILRWREPDLPRPFRVPGPTWVAMALGAGPVGLVFFALWAARHEHVGSVPASLFALAVACCGLPLYLLVRWFKSLNQMS